MTDATLNAIVNAVLLGIPAAACAFFTITAIAYQLNNRRETR